MAVEDTESPLNATVAAAMPGVREEFAMTRQVVKVMEAKILEALFAQKREAQATQETTQRIQEAYVRLESMTQQFAHVLQFAANALSGDGGSRNNSTGDEIGISGVPVRTVATTAGATTVPASTHASLAIGEAVNLQGNYTTLLDMWDEWKGIGKFLNQPIDGGFQALEKGDTTWRKHFSKSEEQDFSRIKRLVCAASRQAEIIQKEGGERAILSEWDILFKGHGRSIRKLVDLFQTEEYNYIPKRKARGRNA